jgi:hypothetical protein
MIVQKGFNSDISYRGSTFHVQTEDWGFERACLVTQIFHAGAVIKTIRVPYTKVLQAQHLNSIAIKVAIEAQHQSVIDLLLSGQLLKA